MFDGGHYDLSVVEAWRALEARLRQVLLSRRIEARAGDPEAVIHAAVRKRILREPTLGVVAELKRHWSVAVSTEPLTREAAVESLSAVRHVLSVIPVKQPVPASDPSGADDLGKVAMGDGSRRVVPGPRGMNRGKAAGRPSCEMLGTAIGPEGRRVAEVGCCISRNGLVTRPNLT